MTSPSSRRAWIEIGSFGRLLLDLSVALLAEGVDRNRVMVVSFRLGPAVALLAEGVDRNYYRELGLYAEDVALLAEGVDRNRAMSGSPKEDIGRPPRGGRG